MCMHHLVSNLERYNLGKCCRAKIIGKSSGSNIRVREGASKKS